MVKLGKQQRGFTLIELMVVISIILILMSIAIPIYNQSIVKAREAVLRDDLYTLRSLIDQYTLDKQRAPQSLVEQEDVALSVDQTQPGITDVHSGSNLTSSDGTAYSTW